MQRNLALLLLAFALCSCGSSGWSHKATPNERQASALAGGFTNDERHLYHNGLQHIYNNHGRIGAYTIDEIVNQERSREQARSQLAERRREYVAAAAQRAREAKARAEEANFFHGDPPCLVLDKRTLTTASGDYTWYIEGKVINRCDHALSYAQVQFNFYDSAGNQENSGLININDLESGQTWSFKKPVYESISDGGKWRVAGVSGF